MKYSQPKKTKKFWISMTAVLVAILILFPCVMVYAEETGQIAPDESLSSITGEESKESQVDVSSVAPEESPGEETSVPENDESSDAGTEHSEPEKESSEDASQPDESGGIIAVIKPFNKSGISVLSVSLPVSNFSELQQAVQNSDNDIEVVLEANVTFTGPITINAGKAVVIKSNNNTARVLSISSTMNQQRHFVVNGSLILESNVVLDGKGSSDSPLGGGIEVRSGGSLTARGAIIRNCKSEIGGGVALLGNAGASMSAGSIQNCVAAWGGGVFLESGSFRMSGTAVIEGCTATGTETPQGGGVLVSAGTFEMTGSSQIRNCTATQTASSGGQGGGVFVNIGGTAILGSSDGTASPVISGCVAHIKVDFQSPKTGDWGGQGGGIYSDSGTITMYPGFTVSGSHASNNGGGVFAYRTNLNVLGGTVTGCTSANGGGVFIIGKNASIPALSIASCMAYYEGGGMVVNGAQVTLGSGVSIHQCSAGTPYLKTWWSGKGGGIYLSNNSASKLIMQSGSSVTDCAAITTEIQNQEDYSTLFGSGGGIYVDINAQAQLTGVHIANCSADHHGGGIFVKKYENLTTQNVTFSGNTAAFYRIPADNVVAGAYPASYNSKSNREKKGDNMASQV